MNGSFRILSNGAAALLTVALLAGCAKSPEALVGSAREHLAKNDRPGAIIELRNALQKNPDMAEARFLLGKTLADTDDLADAEKELRKAKELGYPADEVVPLIAAVMVNRGQFKGLVDEFKKTKLTTPAATANLDAALGKARMALGDVEGAKASFSAARKVESDHPPSMVGEARLAATAGDLPAALAIVDAALAKDPKLTEGWQLKGDILLAQQQPDAAIAAYRHALETKPDYVAAHYMLVSQLVRMGRNDEANKQYEAMKAVAPKHPQTIYVQAMLAYRDKNYVAARDALQLHLKAAPNSLPGLMLNAQVNYQLGAYAQSENVLAAVLQQMPKNVFARKLLAQTYLRDGKPMKAQEVIQPLLEGSEADSDTLALAGEIYLRNGDATAAAGYFEKAADLDPKNAGKRAAAGISRMAMGEAERGMTELQAAAAEDTGVRADLALVATNIRQGKLDAAMTAIDAIEKKQPNTPLVYNLRGGVLVNKRDFAGARSNFERAIAVDPAYYPAVANLAKLDLMEKKPDDARKRYEALLTKDPKNVQALLAIAGLRAQAGGTPDEVAALIGKAIAANPTDAQARFALIEFWLRSKDAKKAVVAAQEAMAALPDRADILSAAADAYRAAGDTNQALTLYNKITQLRPDSPLPYLRMAEIQAAAKDDAAARESLGKALAIKPDLIEAQRGVVALNLVQGRTNEALAVARDVQKQRPKESAGYLLEGGVYAARKSWSEAANAYRAGLRQVGSADLAIGLHAALLAGGKGAEAGALASSWQKDHPKDRTFRAYLAQAAIASKDYSGASKLYKALLEERPEDPLVLNNLAWVSGQMKDPKAIEYAEKAYAIAPENASILDTYGMLLVEKGDTARGVQMLQKAVSLAPNAGQTRLNLASALVKSGQKDAARKELDAVVKLGGKYAEQAEAAKVVLGL